MRVETIETYDLIVFLTVAHTGSFSSAATELRLATPSISSRMSALERKVETQLFKRTARGSALTEAGQRFRSYAQRCLSVLEEARGSLHEGELDRVVISAPGSLGAVIFAPVLRVLAEAGLSAHCRVSHSHAIIDDLLDGTADAGFVINGVFPSTLLSRRICRSPILTVTHPEHQLNRRARWAPYEILDSRIAMYRWNSEAAALGDIFDRPRHTEHPVQLIGLPSAIVELVKNDRYLGVLPEFAVARELEHGSLVEVNVEMPKWALDIQVVFRRDAETRPVVQTLLSNLSEISLHLKRAG